MKKIKNLPPMKCDAGCGACCGVVPATVTEFSRISRFATYRGLSPVLQGETCPWYQMGALASIRGRRLLNPHPSCVVYEVRPLMCRVFGHSENMPCERGYNTNIPDREIWRMVRANGACHKLLHEHLVEAGLVESIEQILGEKGAEMIKNLQAQGNAKLGG